MDDFISLTGDLRNRPINKDLICAKATTAVRARHMDKRGQIWVFHIIIHPGKNTWTALVRSNWDAFGYFEVDHIDGSTFVRRCLWDIVDEGESNGIPGSHS